MMRCMGGRRRMAAGMDWWAEGGWDSQPLQVAGCWTWARTARAAFTNLYTAGGATSVEFAANKYPRAANFVENGNSRCITIC